MAAWAISVGGVMTIRHRGAGLAAVLLGVPVLILSPVAGAAGISQAASVPGSSGTGHVKFYGGIDNPGAITAGPGGTAWFTDGLGGRGDDGSIGRITSTGAVHVYTGTGIDGPAGATAGAGGGVGVTHSGNRQHRGI